MGKKILRALKIIAVIILILAVLAGLFILLCEWPVYQEL